MYLAHCHKKMCTNMALTQRVKVQLEVIVI